MPKRPYPHWQHRHEAVLLWCLQNPRMKQNDCARETGYSRGQVSRIINSPDFQREYQAAREIIREEITKRAFGIVS